MSTNFSVKKNLMYVKKGSKEKVKFLETSSHANLKLNFPVL